MRHERGRRYSSIVIGVLMLLLAGGMIFNVPQANLRWQKTYERIMLALYPSAERAFQYGDRHFNALEPKEYDVAWAESLFDRAYALNPKLLHLQHERARIAFLKGDFAIALARIDAELALQTTPSPDSYYIRGLIEGFAGEYDRAIVDYETYLRSDSKNWAAINDYAWVLLKANRPMDALIALDWGLIYFPQNPWLLNSKATALFELERLDRALVSAHDAAKWVDHVTEEQWLRAYPGNDPLIAEMGIAEFKSAVLDNMHSIELAIKKERGDM